MREFVTDIDIGGEQEKMPIKIETGDRMSAGTCTMRNKLKR